MGCGGCGRNQIPTQYENYVTNDSNRSPKLHPDGVIEFFKEPIPVIEGYDTDPYEPMKLIPKGSGCAYRITGILMQKNGTHIPHHVCRHSKCEHKGKPVTFDICDSCPLREI